MIFVKLGMIYLALGFFPSFFLYFQILMNVKMTSTMEAVYMNASIFLGTTGVCVMMASCWLKMDTIVLVSHYSAET